MTPITIPGTSKAGEEVYIGVFDRKNKGTVPVTYTVSNNGVPVIKAGSDTVTFESLPREVQVSLLRSFETNPAIKKGFWHRHGFGGNADSRAIDRALWEKVPAGRKVWRATKGVAKAPLAHGVLAWLVSKLGYRQATEFSKEVLDAVSARKRIRNGRSKSK
jgi:hypothetical protein